MFDINATAAPSSLRARVTRLGAELGGLDAGGLGDVELVALLGELEVLKCRVEAAQVVAAAALDVSVRAAHAASGVPADRQGLGGGVAGGVGASGVPPSG
ncbi:MAG: hypothetical protein ABIV05_06040 [Actinomycetota bacterium]